jgi:small-conductance mechanosensitive channel
VRSAVNLAVLQRLNSLGIEIPFPQRVLHGRPGPGPAAAAAAAQAPGESA